MIICFVSGYLDHPDFDNLGLTIKTDMPTIVKVMASTDSGLVVRDRMWLKITIPNAFIGMLDLFCLCLFTQMLKDLVGCIYNPVQK